MGRDKLSQLQDAFHASDEKSQREERQERDEAWERGQDEQEGRPVSS